METCTVEVGLLKKKPCGHASVTRCQNCEQPLCKDHAVPQTSEAGHKTGKFMCKQCDVAHREFLKSAPPAPAPKKAAAAAPAPAPAAQPKPAAPAAKPEEKKPDDGGLDFEPTKK
jgi:hypothetical protein